MVGENMDKKAFGRRVNIARKQCGLTGEKLAEMCNINSTYLRQIESGMKIPSLPVFVLLCERLSTSPNFLLRDSLANVEYSDYDDISSLIKNASTQNRMVIKAIVKSAVEALDEISESK